MRKRAFKLFADECVEQHFIDHLREEHNLKYVKSVIEEGLRGKPDEIILKYANDKRRFLITNNKNDFFTNDKLFPFRGLFGIIAFNFHKSEYPCGQLLRIARHEKQSLIEKKFLIKYEDITVKYVGKNGRIYSELLDENDCILCWPELAK